MSDIHELNRRRAEAQMALHAYNMRQTPTDPKEQVAAMAQHRLLNDAWLKAEKDYAEAMNALSTDELIALANSTANPSP